MKLLIGFFFAALVAQISTKPESDSAKLTVVKGNNLFTKTLYNELATKDGNVFFSPISAHAILSLLYQGAGGETSNAFAKVLNVPNKTAAAKGYRQVLNRLNTVRGVTVLMANKVYLMKKYKVQDNFKKAAIKNFYSGVQKVNFAENVKTADVINHWVKEKTHNKIQDFINADTLNADTRLVLVNAIYFNANWAKNFDRENTYKQRFYINENDHVEVDMMHELDWFNYKEHEGLGAKILQLPYVNNDFSLIIILPNERTGINNLEQKLNNTDLTQITKDLWQTYVNLSLPKFKIESKIILNDVLKKMGLGIIFEKTKADFSKLINGNKHLHVSEVLQKAFIEVSEEGTEAAAVTDSGSGSSFMDTFEPENFNADHPFYITLIEKNFNVLFSGRFVKP